MIVKDRSFFLWDIRHHGGAREARCKAMEREGARGTP